MCSSLPDEMVISVVGKGVFFYHSRRTYFYTKTWSRSVLKCIRKQRPLFPSFKTLTPEAGQWRASGAEPEHLLLEAKLSTTGHHGPHKNGGLLSGRYCTCPESPPESYCAYSTANVLWVRFCLMLKRRHPCVTYTYKKPHTHIKDDVGQCQRSVDYGIVKIALHAR